MRIAIGRDDPGLPLLEVVRRQLAELDAKMVVASWLGLEFAGGGSAPKVARMKEIEESFR